MEVLPILRELLPPCAKGGLNTPLARCFLSPDLPQKELRIYREKMMVPAARRSPSAEGQNVLGILRQSGNLLGLGNSTALARSLLFLEKGLVAMAWTKAMTSQIGNTEFGLLPSQAFQIKDAAFCYIPYEDMRRVEFRNNGPYRWLEITALGSTFRLWLAWCNQDRVRELLARLSAAQ